MLKRQKHLDGETFVVTDENGIPVKVPRKLKKVYKKATEEFGSIMSEAYKESEAQQQKEKKAEAIRILEFQLRQIRMFLEFLPDSDPRKKEFQTQVDEGEERLNAIKAKEEKK